MCSRISGNKLNHQIINKSDKSPAPKAKEFDNLQEALGFASKDPGDELIVESASGKKPKLTVIDIEDKTESDTNTVLISHDNGKIEFPDKVYDYNKEVSRLSGLAKAVKEGNTKGLSINYSEGPKIDWQQYGRMYGLKGSETSLENLKIIEAKISELESRLKPLEADIYEYDTKDIEKALEDLKSIKSDIKSQIKTEESFLSIMEELKSFYISNDSLNDKNRNVYKKYIGTIDQSKRPELEKSLLETLQNPEKRKVLIEKFKVNTPENIDRIVLTMVNEAHGGSNPYSIDTKKPDENRAREIMEDVFPIGAAAMNRHLLNLLITSSSYYVKHESKMDGYQPVSMEQSLTEKTGGGSPMVAYAAYQEKSGKIRSSSSAERKSKIELIKSDYQQKGQDSAHAIDYNAAQRIINGEVEFKLKKTNFKDTNKEDIRPNLIPPRKDQTFKFREEGDSYIVNSGAFFVYASTADVTDDILDQGRGFIRTPNTHKIGPYAPGRGLMIRNKYWGPAVKDKFY